ncbi:MAG: putative rane-associated phospholipid phosphatase [Thermoleophilia bacterium]|nr:putative rane-associated phospholipid phosphatase [Thermoleophilia bacterium]
MSRYMQLSGPTSVPRTTPLPARLEVPVDVPIDARAPSDARVPIDARAPSAPGAATAAAADGPFTPLADDAPFPAVAAEIVPKLPGLPGKDSPGWSLGDLLGPPKAGSLAARADMATVKGAQLLRTPERDEWANRMADDGAMKVWFQFAKQHRGEVGKVRGWLDTALLAATMASNSALTQVAKQKFDRQRPYQVDPSIKPPVHLPRDSSYPSGHTSSAFAAARVISTLEPTLAAEAYDIASQVAASRVYAGVHFPTDVVAGALLGTGVADAALRAAHKKGSAPLDPADVIAAMDTNAPAAAAADLEAAAA